MRNRRINILMMLLSLCFSGIFLLAQTDTISDSQLVAFFEKSLAEGRPEQVIDFADQGLEIAQLSSDKPVADSLFYLVAKAYQQKENIPEALRYYLLSLKIREGQESPAGLMELNLELAELYENWGLPEKAVNHFAKASSEAEKRKDQIAIPFAGEGMARNQLAAGGLEAALKKYKDLNRFYRENDLRVEQVTALRNIIKIEKELKDFEAALSHNEQVLKINKELGDTSEIIVSHNNIGVLRRQMGQLQEALPQFIQAAELEEIYRQQGSNPITLTNIGILYQNLGDYQNSLRYLFDAEGQLKKQKEWDVPMLANINNLISIIYLTLNDFNNAYQYNQNAIVFAKNLPDKNMEQLCYKTRSSIYENINDYKEALHYYRLHTHILDSLRQDEMTEKESNLYRQFSAEKTEKEMSLLIVDKEVEELKLKQGLLENEQLRQEQELQKNILENERLEREQAEQALQLTQQELANKETEQNLLLTRQRLEAEQKDRQIALLEKEQSEQTLRLTEQRLEAEQKEKEFAQTQQEKAELNLTVQEKDFEIKNQREKLLRNSIMGILFTTLVVLALLYRNTRIRRKANEKLEAQKQELEKALADLKQAQGQLVQSEKMASLGELTAGIAHEINNPLNFVMTNAHALKLNLKDISVLLDEVHKLKTDGTSQQVKTILNKIKELDTEFLKKETNELIESIERGAERTRNIVLGLRVFSRKSLDDAFAPADLHEGIESTLTVLNSKIKNRITVHRDYGRLPLVPCQFDKMNQVFMNILNNAIQAIEGKGGIFIKTKKKNGGVEISIRDTGSGMPEEIRQRVFEPFFTTKEVGKGTGLGLSISYGIVEQHQGNMTVRSGEGKGTEFVLYLPTNNS